MDTAATLVTLGRPASREVNRRYLGYPYTPEVPGCTVGTVDAGELGALQRARIEAALPRLVAAMYPDWHVFEAAGEWHACRRGHFRQEFLPGAPLFAVHAGSPAGLWAKLVTETDKTTTVPMVSDAGDSHHRSRVLPSLPRVHAQGRRPGSTLLPVRPYPRLP